jgi:hypothetical protein
MLSLNYLSAPIDLPCRADRLDDLDFAAGTTSGHGGRMGVAPLYFAVITALSLFLLLQMTVSRYDVPTTDIAPTHDSVIISQRR